MARGKPISPETIAAIKADWIKGDSPTKIARRYGVVYRTVWRHVAGLKQEKRIYGYKFDHERAIALLAEGLTQTEVARRMGVTRVSVYNALRQWRRKQRGPLPRIPRPMSKTHKLTEGDISEIRDAWVNGEKGEPVSLSSLAMDYDVTKRCIWYHVNGLERKVGPLRPKPRIDRIHVAKLHMLGIGSAAIAERTGMSQRWIQRVLTDIRKELRHAA